MGAHIPNPSPRPASILPAAVGRVRLGHLLKLPNIISLCRIGMVPIFLVLLSKDRFTAALYVFVLAALTDALDGAVARWFDIRTELGAILDPFADKLMLLSALVVLDLRAHASGLAFDPDRDPRHRTGARLPDDLVRRGRTLPGPAEHVRQNDHGAAHRMRALAR